MLPPDHPQRLILANEVHARPSEPVEAPSRASFVALLIDADQREREWTHIAALFERFGIVPPTRAATHFAEQFGEVRLKWERHGEFSGYTMLVSGMQVAGSNPEPFSEPAASLLPPDWLSSLPGSTIVAAHALLIPGAPSPLEAEELIEYFGSNVVVGGDIGDGAGLAYTDFRICPDGFVRFLVVDRSFTPRQAGRSLQRLFEIEAYRVLALLALPIAQRQSPRTLAIEQALAVLTDRIAAEGCDDEVLLQELTRLAAEVESGIAANQFRFNACRAYHQLVLTRIGELRERRLPGMQTIEEFMARRLTPAVATCATVSQRLHDLSERVAQASGLLSTRVDITRERQNQALLASMNRRAKLQLRLQETVEGLSVAAIVYYLAGLVGYVAKAAKAGGLPIQPDLAVGLAIPVVAGLVVLAVRKARKAMREPSEDE